MDFKRKLPSLFLFLFAIGAQAQDPIANALNEFSVDLLATASADGSTPRNLALSPYTVWSLLSIINEGANGATRSQMEKVLRIPPNLQKQAFRIYYNNLYNKLAPKSSGVNLDVFNAIYASVNHTLKPDYKAVTRAYYRVDVQSLDFQDTKKSTEIINKSITQATRNRIQNFIHPGDLTNALIVIVSALYFRGDWMIPFNRSQTYRDTFYDEKQNKLGEVDMMYHMGPFPYTRLDHIKGYAVELPYGPKGSDMSMIVILPYRDESVQSMLELMRQQPFNKVMDMLDAAKEEFDGEDVKVYLPRFNVKSDLTLNKILTKMGIVNVFDEMTADLLGMFEHYLAVSRLIQRAEIDVNEEGTVATAASGATLVNKSPPPKFLANKPFLYFIVNKPSRSIVFAGKVSTPP